MASPASSFRRVQSFWSLLAVFAVAVMDAGPGRHFWDEEQREAQGDDVCCRISRAELGSAAPNQSPPLSHCVCGSPRASLAGQALPGIPWH